MKILVTGFEPFGKDAENAAWEAVSRLPDSLAGAQLIRRRLPVEYDRVEAYLAQLIDESRPDAVLCVGQAAGRTAITPEKVAINWKSSGAADNAGVVCRGERIIPDGADAYFSTLPVEKIMQALLDAEIPAQVSLSAGAYVCNCTFYSLLHCLRKKAPNTPGGFIHVPYTCRQAAAAPGVPSLPLPVITRALETAILAMIEELRGL